MISTHILDTSLGVPAEGVTVTLQKMNQNEWETLATEKTNADGRIVYHNEKAAGSYRLIFAIEDYYKKQNMSSFFLNVPVSFQITDLNRKYHVPILLNPFGYSTYRGS